MRKTILLTLLTIAVTTVSAQTAIGRWRDCADLVHTEHIAVAPEVVYCSAPAGIIVYDKADHRLSSLSRASGLSDVGISTIAYDIATESLVIAYENANIDILQHGAVHNIGDIKRSDFTFNKSIHQVRFNGGMAYICTDFGVVVADLQRHEIVRTWMLGEGGTFIPVNDIAWLGDSIYAATIDGILRINKDNAHPEAFDRWQADGRLQGITPTKLSVIDWRLIVAGFASDPLLQSVYSPTTNGDYTELCSGDLHSMQCDGSHLVICLDDTLRLYTSDLTLAATHSTYFWGELNARDAILDSDGTIWVAHPWDGIVELKPDGTDDTHAPNTPASQDNVYRLVGHSNSMILCPGGHSVVYDNVFLPANLFIYTDHHWQKLDNESIPADSYDLVDAAVNPHDGNEIYAALWGSGIALIRDGKIQSVFNEENTDGALVPYTVGNYSSLRTGALAFDRQGNLWVTNSHSNRALVCRKTDGTWQSFATGALGSLLQIDKIVCDSITGYIWMVGRDNAIYVHDGTSRMAQVNPNRGSRLQTETVNAIAQDRNGYLWIGTNKGIKVIYDGYNAFRDGGTGEVAPVSCSNITISNGLFAEYLMAYENITAIAIDGANRKWIGTASGGIYLISANGQEQLLHFTTADSPLFSDKIVAIGIQPQSGEVYIGTDRGLQVYRSDATHATAIPQSEIYAFPNPVRPDYDGPIAIKGFTRDALIHITDAAGHTVFSSQAAGGQVLWNGKTDAGERVATGVYYVFASDKYGQNRSVAKIAVIR